jgi:hypothetical protein
MSEHYTKNTVMVSVWCNPCARITVHRVFNGRRGPCTECLAKRERESSARKTVQSEAEQLDLFAAGGRR